MCYILLKKLIKNKGIFTWRLKNQDKAARQFFQLLSPLTSKYLHVSPYYFTFHKHSYHTVSYSILISPCLRIFSFTLTLPTFSLIQGVILNKTSPITKELMSSPIASTSFSDTIFNIKYQILKNSHKLDSLHWNLWHWGL